MQASENRRSDVVRGNAAVRTLKIRRIEDVENFPAQFDVGAFPDGDSFEQRDVRVVVAGTSDDVASGVSEAIGACRNAGERAGVEKSGRRSFAARQIRVAD